MKTKAPEVLTTPGASFLVAGEGFEPPTGFYPVGDSMVARSYAVAVVNNEGSC
jgi:hypothetical protein